MRVMQSRNLYTLEVEERCIPFSHSLTGAPSHACLSDFADVKCRVC